MDTEQACRQARKERITNLILWLALFGCGMTLVTPIVAVLS